MAALIIAYPPGGMYFLNTSTKLTKDCLTCNHYIADRRFSIISMPGPRQTMQGVHLRSCRGLGV